MMGYLSAAGQATLANLRTALAYGTVVASFNIESFSINRLRQIDRQQIEDRFRQYQSMMMLTPAS